jgi:hypothetical protein
MEKAFECHMDCGCSLYQEVGEGVQKQANSTDLSVYEVSNLIKYAYSEGDQAVFHHLLNTCSGAWIDSETVGATALHDDHLIIARVQSVRQADEVYEDLEVLVEKFLGAQLVWTDQISYTIRVPSMHNYTVTEEEGSD